MIERKELIRRMREKGLTYRDIGEILDISRQRAHQILSGYKTSAEARRRYRKAHKAPSKPRSKMTYEQVRDKQREYYRKNRERILERDKRRYALKKQEGKDKP